jgi:haloacetate dehalogenase
VPLFEGFASHRIKTRNAEIFVRTKGSGSPLLLLHGYPQTHAMWHAVAPELARHHFVICVDLRGYGDSSKVRGDASHEAMSKRALAADMVEVVAALGFQAFKVAGHDRGGRVTHRMCLDHPNRVTKAAVLDIVPTRTLFEGTNKAIAEGYYHWFFLSRPFDLPERLIGGDPLYYLHSKLGGWSAERCSSFAHPEAIAEYERCFVDPGTIHSSCEDYRAGATIDLAHDETDDHARIRCPLHILWGRHGLMEKHFDVLETWRRKAESPVSGKALDCGHNLPEEAPGETTNELLTFFSD